MSSQQQYKIINQFNRAIKSLETSSALKVISRFPELHDCCALKCKPCLVDKVHNEQKVIELEEIRGNFFTSMFIFLIPYRE